MRASVTVMVVAFGVLAAACGSGDAPAPASPSSAFPSESDGTTGGSISPGAVPTSLPSMSSALTSGRVSFDMTGAVRLRTTLDSLLTAIGGAPPGGFALVWAGRDATSFGIGGAAFVGTRPTSPTLTLTIAAPTSSGFATWVSSAGECRVSMETAETSRMIGTFSCAALRSSSGEVVDVTGSFRAEG